MNWIYEKAGENTPPTTAPKKSTLRKKGPKSIAWGDSEHKYIIDGVLLSYLFSLRDSVNKEDISNVFLKAGKISHSMETYIPQEYRGKE